MEKHYTTYFDVFPFLHFFRIFSTCLPTQLYVLSVLQTKQKTNNSSNNKYPHKKQKKKTKKQKHKNEIQNKKQKKSKIKTLLNKTKWN